MAQVTFPTNQFVVPAPVGPTDEIVPESFSGIIESAARRNNGGT